MLLQRANGLSCSAISPAFAPIRGHAPCRPLRGYLKEVFDAVSRYVPNVVPCDNKNRARKYYESHGNPVEQLGKSN